ncbi:hypothetical protein N499_0013A, partial [Wolbachia pipientis wVitA]|jgi:hypothetical protein
MSVRP